MKKITKLTVGALAFAMFGLTSCVQDDVTPEVQEIYKNQLGLLQAKTKIANAEAAMKEADARLKEATTERDILNAQEALELSKIDHQIAIIKLQSALEDENNVQAALYAGKYFDAIADITAHEVDLVDYQTALATKLSDSVDLVQQKYAITNKERAIASIESAIARNEAAVEYYQAFLADTSTAAATLAGLEKKRDAAYNARENQKAVVDKLKAEFDEMNNVVDNYAIDASQAEALDGYISNITSTTRNLDYEDALDLQNVINKKLADYETELQDEKDDAAEIMQAITDTFTLSGVDAKYENISKAKAVLKADLAVAAASATAATDAVSKLEGLIEDYNEAIAAYATSTENVEKASSTISELNSQISRLTDDYNEVRAAFLVDPNQKYASLYLNHKDFGVGAASDVLDPDLEDDLDALKEDNTAYYPTSADSKYVNYDGVYGDYTDSSGQTWYEISSVSGNEIGVSLSLKYTDVNTLLNNAPRYNGRFVNYANAVNNGNSNISSIRANDGWWVNVEGDDRPRAIAKVYSELQRLLNLQRQAVQKIKDGNEDAAKLQVSSKELLDKYSLATLNGQLAAAKAAAEDADSVKNVLQKAYDDFSNGAVEVLFEEYNEYVDAAADLEQNHLEDVYAKEVVDALVKEMAATLSSDTIAKIEAKREEIRAAQAVVINYTKEITKLSTDIAYFAEIVRIYNYPYNPPANSVDNVTISAIKTALAVALDDLNRIDTASPTLNPGLYQSLELRKNELQILVEAEDSNVVAQHAKEVARLQAWITWKQEKIAELKALAAKWKALMEKYLA